MMKRNIIFYLAVLGCVGLGLAFTGLVQALGGWKYVYHKAMHRGLSGTYEHRKDLFMRLSTTPGGLVFLGDSITEKCEWAELFRNFRIQNRGIAGDFTLGVLDRLEPVISARPAKVFLMVGVNDLIRHSPATTVANYKKVLDGLQAGLPNTQIFVMSVLPVNNSVRQTSVRNAAINELNEGIQGLAQVRGLPYIPLNERLMDKEGRLKAAYTIDGIHLNGKAYLVWKDYIEHLVN